MMLDYQEQIEKINRIQPLNPALMELLTVIQDSHSQAQDLELIINSDASTSATILKLANSPFYGMSGRIKKVRDACVLLGVDQLRNIIYATALDQASGKGPHQSWRDQLRMHTLATALICSELARFQQPKLDRGQAYSLGLLHELGKQVLLSEMPYLFDELLGPETSESLEFLPKLFVEAGVMISRKWRLPPEFEWSVKHDEAAPDEFKPIVNLVHCGHCLAQGLGFPTLGEIKEVDVMATLQVHYPDIDPGPISEELSNILTDHGELTMEFSVE